MHHVDHPATDVLDLGTDDPALASRQLSSAETAKNEFLEGSLSQLPTGVIVDESSLLEAAEQTIRLVSGPTATILQPVASNAGIVVRVAALRRLSNGWLLIQASPDHGVTDRGVRSAAVALRVFRRAGIDIREVVLAHGTSVRTSPSRCASIAFTDVTLAAEQLQPEIEAYLVELWSKLLPREPEPPVPGFGSDSSEELFATREGGADV